MEKKLIKIFKLADLLNERQDKVYAEIHYISNDKKSLEIDIRSKTTFLYVERCEVYFSENSLLMWDSIIKLFENYVGGAENE